MRIIQGNRLKCPLVKIGPSTSWGSMATFACIMMLEIHFLSRTLNFKPQTGFGLTLSIRLREVGPLDQDHRFLRGRWRSPQF